MVVSEYPIKILGLERMTSKSKKDKIRIESSPPMVEMMALIDESANACIKSSALARGLR